MIAAVDESLAEDLVAAPPAAEFDGDPLAPRSATLVGPRVQEAPATQASIRVRVVERATHAPIAGIEVLFFEAPIEGGDTSLISRVETDPDGACSTLARPHVAHECRVFATDRAMRDLAPLVPATRSIHPLRPSEVEVVQFEIESLAATMTDVVAVDDETSEHLSRVNFAWLTPSKSRILLWDHDERQGLLQERRGSIRASAWHPGILRLRHRGHAMYYANLLSDHAGDDPYVARMQRESRLELLLSLPEDVRGGIVTAEFPIQPLIVSHGSALDREFGPQRFATHFSSDAPIAIGELPAGIPIDFQVEDVQRTRRFASGRVTLDPSEHRVLDLRADRGATSK